MIPSFVIGGVLVVLALVFVLRPIFGSPAGPLRRASAEARRSASQAHGTGDDGVTAIDVLREVEFDRATGKLSETDYAALKATYTERALIEMRKSTATTVRDKPARGTTVGETAVGKCPDCRTRIANDAVYCFNCGRYLAGACPACGGEVRRVAAQFCSACGEELRLGSQLTPSTAVAPLA